MSTERELDEILAEIGREHRAIGAPNKLEAVLCAAASGNKRATATSGTRLAWAWAAVLLVAALVGAGVLWQTRMSHRSQMQQARSEPKPQQDVASTQASTINRDTQGVPIKAAQVRNAERKPARTREAAFHRKTWNSLDEFVPLPASEGLPTAAELRVVRMKLRGSDLQQYGLQTPADAAARTMLAEFVVGEDGLPRAIRILR